MPEKYLKILKTYSPDKWKFLTKKLTYSYEYFNTIDDYQKLVNNLQKEDIFRELKNKCPNDKKKERTKESIEEIIIRNGEKLTRLYLKSDVSLLTCMLEKLIKASINEFAINRFYCVSIPGYTCQCGLNYAEINLQKLQDKHLLLTLENELRGGISSVMGDRYVKSDENKKNLYVDATNLYDQPMSQRLPSDDDEMWHGHPDLYMKKLEETLNTPDDSDIGYFIEVDLKEPNEITDKPKNFPFCPEKKN